MPTGGGGDAAPADSGADASVRPAGRPARTRLNFQKTNIGSYLGSKIKEEKENFLDQAQNFFSYRVVLGICGNNRTSPYNGPINNFFFFNLNILT